MASNKKIVTLVLISLVALAFTGCSDDSATPSAPAIDTAPPAVPAELDIDFDGSAATISWAQNSVDTDLAGYIVVRERYGMSQELVSQPAMINSFVDASPLIGSSMYHVYSVDTAGNQSAVSTTYLTVSLGHQSGELAN